jgi:hypothetical protein
MNMEPASKQACRQARYTLGYTSFEEMLRDALRGAIMEN